MDDDDLQLPEHVRKAVDQIAFAEDEQRAEVLVEDRGRTERVVDGSAPLLRVRMTDLGPVGAYTPAIDPEDAGPDVVSDLRPREARKLAGALLDLADRLDAPDVS